MPDPCANAPAAIEGADLPVMIAIPPGRFIMGSPDAEPGRDDCEGPQHDVIIGRGFALARTPITFAQWDRFVAAGGTAYAPPDEGWGRGDRPVVNVSWDDAQAYLAWLAERSGRAYRLPSESEWEYAARGGTATAYHWGAAFVPGGATCLDGGDRWGGQMTAPVACSPANPFGLHDMGRGLLERVLHRCARRRIALARGAVRRAGPARRLLVRSPAPGPRRRPQSQRHAVPLQRLQLPSRPQPRGLEGPPLAHLFACSSFPSLVLSL